MVPNPFFAKVFAKVVTSFAKSAIKAYTNTLRKNNQAGRKKFKFNWNDIFKHHKMNILNYLDQSKFKQFNPFDRMQDKVMDSMSKNNSHRVSQMEALKILSIDPDTKLTLQFVMEQYLFLYSKNNPESGGSQYIQAKILNAKDMIIEQFGGQQAEQLWRDQNGFHDDEAIQDFKKPEVNQEEDGKDKSENETKDKTEKIKDKTEIKKEELNKTENLEEQKLEEENVQKINDQPEQEEQEYKELTLEDREKLLEEEIKKDEEEIKQMQEELQQSSKKEAKIKKMIQQFEAEAKKYEEDFPEDFKNHENDELYQDKEIEYLINELERIEKEQAGQQKNDKTNKK